MTSRLLTMCISVLFALSAAHGQSVSDSAAIGFWTSNGETETLALRKSSQHFEFYSVHRDHDVLDSIALVLEENYARIVADVQVGFKEKIRAFIYPDLKSFHAAISFPEAPDWLIGAAGINEMRMVSPLNPGPAHTRVSLMQAIVHELVHTALLNLRGGQGLATLPKWLNEGYAYYEARQLTSEMRKAVKSRLPNQTLPSWSTMDSVGIVQFGSMGGYQLSTTIIEFLVNSYGVGKLQRLLRAPEDLERLYGTTRANLEKQWVIYLETM
jgi:hypothetical protein